jgi:filamentous hemagglutinin family protein
MKKILSILGLCSLTIILNANPSGQNVVSGNVNFDTIGNTLNITQTTEKAIVNWNDFSIGIGETTNFNLPNSNSTILNRVTGTNISTIAGTLNSNGNVMLINENGILVTNTGTINVNSFLGSTLDVNNDEFLNNRNLNFVGDKGTIVNHGTINALGGSVTLISTKIENTGTINSAETYIRETEGKGIVRVNRKANEVGHDINANNGNMYALAINKNGVVRGTSVVKKNGQTWLVDQRGNSDIYNITDSKIAKEMGFKRLGNSDNYRIGTVDEPNIVINNTVPSVNPNPIVEVVDIPEPIVDVADVVAEDKTNTSIVVVNSPKKGSKIPVEPLANKKNTTVVSEDSVNAKLVYEDYEILKFKNKEHDYKEYFKERPHEYDTLFRGDKDYGFNVVMKASFSETLDEYTGKQAILDNFVQSMVY